MKYILLPILMLCVSGCTTPRPSQPLLFANFLAKNGGSLDEEKVKEYTNAEVIQELALIRYNLLGAFRSHTCDCPDSVKPWQTVMGNGCKDYFEAVSNLSKFCDALQDEFNGRNIPQEEKAGAIRSIQEQWPQEMEPNERKDKEALLRYLLNTTDLSPLHGVAMFVAILHVGAKECDLDETAFDQDGIVFVEEQTGIDLPDGAKGLKLHYIPPIDPIVFAKIQIAANAQESLTKQIEALKGIEFPNDFAYDRCDWWPPPPEHVVLSRRAVSNGYYVELHLVNEDEHLVLYIQYFTI